MKGLLILVDGFEDGEALVTRDLLLRAGIKIVTASYSDKREVVTGHNLTVIADELLTQISVKDYHFLVIPGGSYVSGVIENDKLITSVITDFNKQEKMIAAICAAPSFLGVLGLLDSKFYTCYPSFEIYMPNGKYLPSEKVVVEKNIITSRSLGTVFDFSFAIIEYLKGSEAVNLLKKEIVY